jgi:hypothetical protein
VAAQQVVARNPFLHLLELKADMNEVLSPGIVGGRMIRLSGWPSPSFLIASQLHRCVA